MQVRNAGRANEASLRTPLHVIWWTDPRKEASSASSDTNLQARTDQFDGPSLIDNQYEGHHGSSRKDSGLSLRIYGRCGRCFVENDRLVRF